MLREMPVLPVSRRPEHGTEPPTVLLGGCPTRRNKSHSSPLFLTARLFAISLYLYVLLWLIAEYFCRGYNFVFWQVMPP